MSADASASSLVPAQAVAQEPPAAPEPAAYTAVFFLVALALLFVFLGVNEGSTGMLKAGGYVALVFAAIGAYRYASTAAVATGGRPLPLGRPLLR